MAFLDLFSGHASHYAAARPGYPDALFKLVASLAGRRAVAWDCACGNGQATIDLARYFERVIGTDASSAQIAQAVAAPNVEYRVAPAESSGLQAQSVDAVTVAQALHWFDHDRFYAEVRRVTVPGGVVAAWSYGSCSAGEDVAPLLREFEHEIVGPYWSPERRWVDEGYRTIPFPFREIGAPAIRMRETWTLTQLAQYLSSWSAVQKYRRDRGEDPVAPLMERLARRWVPEEDTREITWPLAVRVGRLE